MPNPGDLLMGRYRILERLGSGGMATVHRARDERLERDVAVKILLPNLAGDPSTAARFEREARSLAASSHPGVVAVFDVDAGDPSTGREPFFVMELCRGGSLADRFGGGQRMAPDDLVPILVPVADGLADLHRRGVVHRDIKPQNILFGDDRAKLADFGLAQSNDGQGPSELTTPGTAVGTLAYLAPEVLAGERATAAADVYGLGVVAFVGLTGQPPRPVSSMAELVTSSGSAAPAVSTVAPDLGPAFDDIVGGALAVGPNDRPDALSFASGLAAALGRWTRDGGPARRSAAPVGPDAPLDAAFLVGVGRPPAGEPALADDATTAIAIPLGATASLPLEASGARGPARDSTRTGVARATSWVGRATVVAALVLAVMIALVSRIGSAPSSGPGASTAASPAPLVSAPVPSSSPSIPPSPPAATPSPKLDPAFASLTAMDAAISAARGGPDGLKGKEANDLEERTAAVRRALDAGDRSAALDAARKLDHRIADLAKDLGRDQATRLRTASQDLVRALGG
ncbi:MAG TPA: serine/threonine-protein kinase [Candidatus Limnocylindrales bacterium]|nr:serine/threonine-protein kinase [Candidatus Limnocylindrales bacterium]